MHSRIDPKTIIRLTKPIIFSSFVLAGIADQALAGDECGIAALGNVTCTDAGNPYAGGITYTPTSALTVDVQNGVVVNRAPGTTNYGVHVTGQTPSPTRSISTTGLLSIHGAIMRTGYTSTVPLITEAATSTLSLAPIFSLFGLYLAWTDKAQTASRD